MRPAVTSEVEDRRVTAARLLEVVAVVKDSAVAVLGRVHLAKEDARAAKSDEAVAVAMGWLVVAAALATVVDRVIGRVASTGEVVIVRTATVTTPNMVITVGDTTNMVTTMVADMVTTADTAGGVTGVTI